MNKESNKLPLHAGVSPYLFENAKKLRSDSTKAEQVLWKELRARRFMNLKFRRQHALHNFIVDFYCHELKLIVEADGGYHYEDEQIKLDKSRTNELENLGFTLIRFKNDKILGDLEEVLARIKVEVFKLKSHLT